MLGWDGVWPCLHLNARLDVDTDSFFSVKIGERVQLLCPRSHICSVSKEATFRVRFKEPENWTRSLRPEVNQSAKGRVSKWGRLPAGVRLAAEGA